MRSLKIPFAVLLSLVLCLFLLLFPPLETGSTVKSAIETELPDTGVDFIYEKITLEIKPAELRVTGLYRFQNRFPFDITLPMLYPFPVDEYQDFPHTIDAKSITVHGERTLNLGFRRLANAIRLDLPMRRKSSAEMKVTYSQRLTGSRARYILTTTKAWGKPIESADYEIILPAELRLDFISLPFDRTDTIAGKRYYYSHKGDFMPDRDLIVEWE